MATTYRIAVIGSWESVMGFRALGLETYPVTAPEEARETIRELAKSGDCGIIYLTEHKKEQIRLITDSTYVLTGDLVDRYNAACLYSSNHNLAEVFKDALANEIKLLEIKKGNQ